MRCAAHSLAISRVMPITALFEAVYDGTRTLKIMGMDGKVSGVEINKHGVEQQQQPDGTMQAVEKIMNDMSDVAEFGVTVSTGPSYDTLRQEAMDGMIQTAQNWPKLMDIAGDKVIRSMDWPMAEEIADRVAKTIPPELRNGEDGTDADDANMVDTPFGKVPVSQLPDMLAHMKQQMEQMSQQLQEAASGIDKAKIDAASRERVAEINAASKADVAELQGWIQLLVQKLQPPPVLTAQALTRDPVDSSAGGEQVSDNAPQPAEQQQLVDQSQQSGEMQ